MRLEIWLHVEKLLTCRAMQLDFCLKANSELLHQQQHICYLHNFKQLYAIQYNTVDIYSLFRQLE